MFDGCRLHPHIWSTLGACADAGLPLDETLTVGGLREAMEGVRARGRHTGPGVPDLFLWRHRGDGVPYGAGFVEVKRHAKDSNGKWCREPVSKTQKQELAFLTALGLSARTVYIREIGRFPKAITDLQSP